MLTLSLVDSLLSPVREGAPCGDDLEYDPAFTALEIAAQGKPEQQFGETVIAAVEPKWPDVAEQAQALLMHTKDLRPAVLLVRAVTHEQGLEGLLLGLQLLTNLLDRYWDQLHPHLDTDDGNDPTMRMNALVPLNDETMLVRDLYDVLVGVSRSMGPVSVREIAASHGVLSASAETPSQVQMLNTLAEIQAEQPALAQTLAGLTPALNALQRVVRERSGQDDLLELGRLVPIGKLLAQIGSSLGGNESQDEVTTDTEVDTITESVRPVDAPRGSGIHSRQDAIRMLDRVIAYLEQAEPGNPAPLLLARAKLLIGVSFFDIITNLAPNALDTIETVTGCSRRPKTDHVERGIPAQN